MLYLPLHISVFSLEFLCSHAHLWFTDGELFPKDSDFTFRMRNVVPQTLFGFPDSIVDSFSVSFLQLLYLLTELTDCDIWEANFIIFFKNQIFIFEAVLSSKQIFAFFKIIIFRKNELFFCLFKITNICLRKKSNLHFAPPWFFRSANSECKSVTVCRKVSASSKAFFAFSASDFHATACWRTERGSGKLRGKNRTDFGKSIKYRSHAT